MGEIDNSEYEEDTTLYAFESFCGIGFDLWQVKSGTIFDNVLITDDIEEAKKQGDDLWKATSEAEKKMKEAQDEEEKKKADEEAKNSEPEDDEDVDDEEFDDEDEDADIKKMQMNLMTNCKKIRTIKRLTFNEI